MVFNIDDLVLELNGHVVEGGFSDDADAIMFEPIELVGDPRVGADGSVAFFASGNKGGTFTLKLLPNSPSIPFFIQQANVVRDGGSVTWQGSLRDVRRGISVQFRNWCADVLHAVPEYRQGLGQQLRISVLFRGDHPFL